MFPRNGALWYLAQLGSDFPAAASMAVAGALVIGPHHGRLARNIGPLSGPHAHSPPRSGTAGEEDHWNLSGRRGRPIQLPSRAPADARLGSWQALRQLVPARACCNGLLAAQISWSAASIVERCQSTARGD
ncbi:hypothetical protein G7Z17_g8553 [Cylindrodendrum hubeiense]|uniref:Uncharacterized protein n=1 Tax=Cylindrodendrum hubeiense TaxID=595255 RepID=A0A9P5H1U8_9HYPO|nr:hypothetical protein G7Z17_g8553 [Cylindrodendrum hubeiense]